MTLRGGTVRAHLQAIGRVATIPGATEHTYRAALGEFLGMAVRTAIEMAPDLDAALGSILADTLSFGDGA